MKKTWLLVGMLFAALLMHTLGRDPSFVRGIGYPDIFMGAVLGLVVLDIALGHRPELRERPLPAAFAIWCTYGVLSWAIVVVLGDYQNYEAIKSGMRLKASLFDYAFVFAACFLGTRGTEDVRFVLKALLGGVFVGTLMHVLDAAGVFGMGLTVVSQGRVQGIMGEANQTAVLVAGFIPLFVGMALSVRGVERLFWFAGAAVLLMEMLITASRGGPVGLFLAAVAGLFLLRRMVSPGRVLAFATGGIALVVVTVAILGVQYRSLLAARFIGQTTATGAADLSSGRTDIWATMLDRMMDAPWSFLTGMGWDTYGTFGFQSAPHNTYFGIWFNLGLIGVACFVFILGRTVVLARKACSYATPADRPVLMGAAIGVLASAAASFFVDVWIPQMYIWAVVGLTARMSVSIAARAPDEVPARGTPTAEAGDELQADAWGWRSHPDSRSRMGARRA